MAAKPLSSDGMSLKRKRVVLSLRDKVDVIECLLKGESGSSLARKYGVGSATISDIKRNSESILKFVSSLDNENGSLKKKTMKTAENINLDSAIYAWYMQKKSNGEPVNGPLICEKALELNKKTNGDPEFKASTGWLTRFKIRHSIRFQDESAPPPPADPNVVANAAPDKTEYSFKKFQNENTTPVHENILDTEWWNTPTADGLKAEYRAGYIQKSGGLKSNGRFFNLLDKVLGQQSVPIPRTVSHDDGNVVAILELPNQDGSGPPTLVTEEFVVESQDSDEDNQITSELVNGTSSRSSIESGPIQIKVEYDADEPEMADNLDPDEPESTEVANPETHIDLFNSRSVRKRKSNVKQIEDVLNRVLDNTINRFIAFEQAMDKRAREETNTFRSKLLAIERRKLEESSTQTLQNERIINLMEALVSQRQEAV